MNQMGSSSGHLTEESALLLQSGELDSSAQAVLEDHFRVCAACRELYQQITKDLEDAQSLIINEGRERLRLALSSRGVKRFAGMRHIAVAATSAAACVMTVILLIDSVTEPLSATQFIERAISEQAIITESRRSVSIHTGRLDCSDAFGTRRQVSVESGACSGIRAALQTAHWDVNDPLSAKTFREWRSSLKNRVDKVSRRSDSLVLRTSTNEGPLHAASLAVQAETFHAVSLRLEIEGAEPVEIEESTAPPIAGIVSATAPAPPHPVESLILPPPTKLPAEDPVKQLDAAGAQVWIRLHRIHADLGFETSVSRASDAVEVFGLLVDDVRAEQLRTELESIRDVRLKLKTYASFESGDDGRFPASEIGNTLPPLANDWLKQNFPSNVDRQAFVDAAVSRTRTLMGLAATLDQLRSFARADASSEFTKVRADITAGAESALQDLHKSLMPYVGTCDPATQAITLDRAHTIDSALVRLVVAARDLSNDQPTEAERLKTALGCAALPSPQR